MSFIDYLGDLTEGLRKPFYSEKEALYDKFKDSTQVSNEVGMDDNSIHYDPFSGYSSDVLNNSITKIEDYKGNVLKWRQLSILPEVDQALQEITSEAIVFDEIEDVISLNLDDIDVSDKIKNSIRDSFANIMYLLDFNERGEELFRQWYVDASLAFEVVYNNRKIKNGIQKLVSLPPYKVMKYKNSKNGEIKWLIDDNKNKTFSYDLNRRLEDKETYLNDEQVTQITSGIFSPDRRMPYSFLQKAVKSINQLYLLEDSLIVMRMSKSTEKRAFYIDTGNLPKSKAEEYIRGLITKYRQKKIYNTELGTIENKNKTISILEDFWFPVSQNARGTKVENLPGIANNFTTFDDVNYFVDKVYNALCVPATRRNKESRLTIGSNIDIERDEMQFFKYILKLRRRFNNMFVDLLKKDILARGIMGFNDWKKIQEKIKFIYANSNEISQFKKLQLEQTRMDSASSALSLSNEGIISKNYIRRYILNLSTEDIEQIAKDIEDEKESKETSSPTGGMSASPKNEPEPDGYSEISFDEPDNEKGDSGSKGKPEKDSEPEPEGSENEKPTETPK